MKFASRISPELWIIPALLVGLFLVALLGSVLPLPPQTVEAKPLGAVREYDVTLKSPDLIVPNTFAVNVGDTIRFRVKQEGPAPHNLHIGGNGVDVESPRWPRDTSAVWEYSFTRPGVYALWCSVLGRIPGVSPTHRDVGPMEGVIVVTEAGTPLADLSQYQTRNVPLQAIGASGISGTAHLQPRADGAVGVRVQLSGLKPNALYFFNVRRNSADCLGGQLGNPSAPVQAEGTTARILQTHGGSLSNEYSVSIREGTSPPGTVVACGDSTKAVLGAGAVVPATPAAPAVLPRTGEGAFFPLALATTLGGLLLGLGVLVRRRAETM